jgi:hypothetical protein
MANILAGTVHLIAFVLKSSAGAVVTGLGTTITVKVSKNGGVFATGAGTKAEISNGWYSYELTAAETDTTGPLAIMVTGTGAVQENLLYDVVASLPDISGGTTILTVTEGANVLRCEETDPELLALLPIIDAYIENATGRDWAADTTIQPEAKGAARMLLVRWHEDPGGMAAGSALGFGLSACLTQLEALALELETAGVPDEGLRILASMPADHADEVAVTVSMVVVFNHAMAAAAASAAVLKTAAGSSVTTTNSLDATGKILTVNPDSDLASDSNYVLALTAAADTYGQTLTGTIGFRTA